MSKGLDLKKLKSNWEKEGSIEQKRQVLDRIPKKCMKCESEIIEYWDETDEEIICQCKICRRFIAIPYRNDKLRFYFSS